MKRILYAIAAVVVVVTAAVVGSSFYLLSYALTPDPNRHDMDSAYAQLFCEYPDMRQWTDSMRSGGLLRDTFVVMPTGERHHALYARADGAHGRTAVIVHGYKDCAVKFLYLGRMYQHDLGWNILMPDLHAHGLSDGDAIQMGWLDRLDVIRWTEVAEELFRDSVCKTQMVVHGVSMGAATTMCVAGEKLPPYINRFVEDCGYTSVADEFTVQLKEQFGLTAFPIIPVAGMLCKMKYGWSFNEASPLHKVSQCRRPMLFIHGDADKFVPTWMLKPLYTAKPGYKEVMITRGTGHARSFHDNPEDYQDKVGTFLRR